MKPHLNAFDFEIDMNGARVVVAKQPLAAGALSDGELEWQIEALKNDLDDLLPKMKRAVAEHKARPLNLRTTS